ncbi:MAG: universal stress protein [Bacteroidia bacterium]|nr:universal stress protein [Bacteroidia bacterium]
MKTIAALIDFTEGCKIALQQAAIIAEKAGAEMHAVYILNDASKASEMEEKVLQFAKSVAGMPANIKATIGTGDLLEGAAKAIRHLDPFLVVVGTHGIKGLKQHLFGAHILKLVQAIPYPCVVVQENTKVNTNGFNSVLFPVGSHPHYHIKIEQAKRVADVFNSEIVQYEIEKSTGVDDVVRNNSKKAKEFFSNHFTRYKSVIEDPNVVSVGYSRQTLKYAAAHQSDLIVLMADVPASEAFYGKADKENFLTNEFGIPVLCCNDED